MSTLRFLVTSDWHLFGRQGNRFGRLDDLRRLCMTGRYDAVLHGGDLVEPDMGATFAQGLHALLTATYSVEHILIVAGNNDLDAVFSNELVLMKDAVNHMAAACAEVGATLLDKTPFTVKGVRFVGNYAGFDGTLFRATDLSRGQTAHDHMDLEARRWVQAGVGAHPGALHAECRRTLLRHLGEDERTPTILVTHTVPVPEMLLYGSSERYDRKNTFMGWDERHAGRQLWRPNVVAHLCGHVHRSYDQHVETDYVRGGIPLLNVSGSNEIREVELNLAASGEVEAIGYARV